MTIDGDQDVADTGLGMLAELLNATGRLALDNHSTLERLDDDAVIATEVHAVFTALRQKDRLACAGTDLPLILQTCRHA